MKKQAFILNNRIKQPTSSQERKKTHEYGV